LDENFESGVVIPSSATSGVLKKIEKSFERILAEIIEFCRAMKQKWSQDCVFASVFSPKPM